MKILRSLAPKQRRAAFALAIISAILASTGVLAAAGVLDPTFGVLGRVTTNSGSATDSASVIAIQPDGKIVVAGSAGGQLLLVRYNPNGSRDSTFGTNGIVTNGVLQVGLDLAIQPADGKILVVGSAGFPLARFNSNGSLDTSFGTNGVVTKEFPGGQNPPFGHSVVLLPDGRILAAGNYGTDTDSNFLIARYNSDGSTDSSLGGNGIIIIDFAVGGGFSDDHLIDASVSPGGTIFAVGNTTDVDGVMHTSFARYNSDGTPDASFGTNGLRTSRIDGVQFQGRDAAFQSDGKIVVAGEAYTGSILDFALARYNPDGSPDAGFGNQGIQIMEFGNDDYATAVFLQSDGKIVTGLYNASGQFALARFNTNGSPDTTFGSNGLVTTDFAGNTDIVRDVVIQSDGKIVAGGNTSNGTTSDVALARYDGSDVTVTPVTMTFRSAAAYDGWILESSEFSKTGGSLDSYATTFYVGDSTADRQFRSLLSFNSASIPDSAVITSVQVKIMRQGLVGTDPFTTHGSLLLDMRTGAFGSNALQLVDFNSASSAGTTKDVFLPETFHWYTANLSSTNLAFINKLGITQFRLRFTLDDNEDLSPDYMKFFTGNAVDAANRPRLIVTYYVP